METEKQSVKSVVNGKNGGYRPGAGRKAGARNKRTAALIAKAKASGILPLDYMLQVMRSPCPPELLKRIEEDELDTGVISAIAGWHETRMDAAKGAAPYVHPKLATLEVKGDPDRPLTHVTRIELVAVAPKALTALR